MSETFVTKAKAHPVKTYLSHFYRSQDYRLQDDGYTLTIYPYSFLIPFASRQQVAKKVCLTYKFEEQEHETRITFTYHISFLRKIFALILPMLFFSGIFLITRGSFGQIGRIDILLLALFLLSALIYSFLQTRNFEKHLIAKNKKLFKDLEEFSHKHLHKGLLDESFDELN